MNSRRAVRIGSRARKRSCRCDRNDEDALRDQGAARRGGGGRRRAAPARQARLQEILNLIAETLAADEDVLLPKGHLNCLAGSCKVIKAAVKDAKDKLKVKYDAARALVVKCGWTVETIVERWPQSSVGWPEV